MVNPRCYNSNENKKKFEMLTVRMSSHALHFYVYHLLLLWTEIYYFINLLFMINDKECPKIAYQYSSVLFFCITACQRYMKPDV